MMLQESEHQGEKSTRDLNEQNCNIEISAYGKMLRITDEEKEKLVSLLTPREYELYLLLLEGFTLKESAKELSIRYSTANTHMTSIYKKLGVNSRAELIINYRFINGLNNKGP